MIHTAFMRFAIDAVFLDSDLEIVKLEPHLGPWRVAAAPGAHAVLELAAGEIEYRRLAVGQRLAAREHVAHPVVWAPPTDRIAIAV
jgi:hypothetical protein